MALSTRNHSLTVSVAGGQVLPPNHKRRVLIISPPSAGVVSLSFGESAVANTGIVLSSTGTTPLVLRWADGDDFITQPLFAISTLAGVLPVVEASEQ